MNNQFILIGASAHGRVILDILEHSGFEVAGFLDDDENKLGKEINGKKVIGKIDKAVDMVKYDYKFIICLGDNYLRENIYQKLNFSLKYYGNAIDKSSNIMFSAKTGYGNMILANTFVGTDVKIGNHVVINNGSIIEHDSIIEDYCSISSGSVIGARVEIQKNVFIGISTTVIPKVTIGKGSIIGAGSLVIKDIPEGVFACGVPARIIKKISQYDLKELML